MEYDEIYQAAVTIGLESGARAGAAWNGTGPTTVCGALKRAGLYWTVSPVDRAVLEALGDLPWPDSRARADALGPLGMRAVGTTVHDRSRWLLDVLGGIMRAFLTDDVARDASVAAAAVAADIVPDPWSYLSWFRSRPDTFETLVSIVDDAYRLPCGFNGNNRCGRPATHRALAFGRETAFVRCTEHAGGPATTTFRAIGMDVEWVAIER